MPGKLFKLPLKTRGLAIFALGATCVIVAILAARAGQPQQQQTNQGQPGNPKPIAAWSFAQADGTFVPDSSGHGYDATIYGQPTLEPLWHKQVALIFDGSGDNSFWQGGAQNCGLGVNKRMDQAFTSLTVEAWVRKDPAGWMPIVYRDLWDIPSGFGLYMEWSAGKAYFGHYDAIGHGSAVQSETVVQDGQWHHVVGTMQPATGSGYLFRIYVDGKLDADNAGVGQWAVDAAPAKGGILKIAYPNSSGADHPLNGAVDGIAIYDFALTPGQVKARFNSTRDRH